MAEHTVAIRAEIPGVDPDAAFARLREFSAYAEHAEVVREITVETEADGGQLSHWSVWFRNGLLQWTERDVVDTAARLLSFEQVSGDLAHFEGSWRVTGSADVVAVQFLAVFDLGIPSLAEILDPLAERALATNTEQILRGLFGKDLVFAEAAVGAAG
ncbi:SRPBCC family protein [Nocardia takedensis]